MAILYFIALLPILVGGALWILNRRVSWIEWAGSSLAAFALAGIFHLIGNYTGTSDTQTISGQIVEARHYTAWKERYEEAVYRTETYYTGSGKNRTRHTRRVFSHWSTETRWHRDKYVLYSNINTEYDVNSETFEKVAQLFGGQESVAGKRKTSERSSKMIDGDPNDRVARPKNGYIYPVINETTFENRIKAGPSVYSFAKVPANSGVFEYPEYNNPFVSGRLLGSAKEAIEIGDWDKINATLGPLKKVNLIAVGFGDKNSEIAQLQRSKWYGGKKNDLVICYGGPSERPRWVVVFGWTDSELVKQNLQTIVLENGFIPKTLSMISKEVVANYQLKDWSAFSHIAIPPSGRLLFWYVFSLLVTQAGLWVVFIKNDFGKCHIYGV